ncbi:UNVERIFIED_ORG: hypothetical protein J2S29_000654 [Rhizobium sp. SLBN-170]
MKPLKRLDETEPKGSVFLYYLQVDCFLCRASAPLIPVLVTGIQPTRVRAAKESVQPKDVGWLDSCDKHRNEGRFNFRFVYSDDRHDAGHPSTGRISVVPSALNTSGLGV